MKVKKQEICPHCGQLHTVTVDIPVRRRNRTTYRPVYRGSRMEYAIAEVDEGFEYALPWKRINDLLFYPVGATIGALSGAIIYMVADAWLGLLDTKLLLSLCSAGGASMLIYTHWILMDMSKQERIKTNLLSYWQNRSVPKPDPGPVVLEVDHRFRDGHTEAGRTVQYFGTLPVDPDDFVEYVKAVLAGETMAINKWTGSGAPFDRKAYDELLAILREAGAVVNLGGNKGHQLTTFGRHAFKRLVQPPGA